MSRRARGSSVAIVMESFRLAYPTATDEELKKGAEWVVRLTFNTARCTAYQALPREERAKELERQMFGEGDHSGKRAALPPGA